VAREQRSVQVRADRPSDAASLEAAFAIVAEAGDDAAERLRAGVEPRPSGVVLEPGERADDTWLELALEQDVADHPPGPGHRLQGEQADAGQVFAQQVAVGTSQQL